MTSNRSDRRFCDRERGTAIVLFFSLRDFIDFFEKREGTITEFEINTDLYTSFVQPKNAMGDVWGIGEI